MRIFFKNFITLGLVGLFLFSNLVLFLSADTEYKTQQLEANEGVLQIKEYVLVDLRVENEDFDDVRAEVEIEEEDYEPSIQTPHTYIYAKCTAYCACEKCCGDYANNRPLDENGKPIVYTASGKRAVPKYTIAMSSNYAFGTLVNIPGLGTCEVMDRGGAVNGNVIDIYFGSHEDALNWGCKWLEVEIYG